MATAKHELSSALLGVKRILIGEKMSKQCLGGFVREIATENGVQLETCDNWIFVPDWMLLKLGYQPPPIPPPLNEKEMNVLAQALTPSSTRKRKRKR